MENLVNDFVRCVEISDTPKIIRMRKSSRVRGVVDAVGPLVDEVSVGDTICFEGKFGLKRGEYRYVKQDDIDYTEPK